jgi:hypothetical protein
VNGHAIAGGPGSARRRCGDADGGPRGPGRVQALQAWSRLRGLLRLLP